MNIIDESSGFCVLLIQLFILIFSIICLRLAKRAVTDAMKYLDDASVTLESFPSTSKPVAWTPVMVGVVGSLFQIKPLEILNEYKKENEAKRWIVINTFPDTELNRKFLEGPYASKFMSLGYTFKQEDSLQNPTTIMTPAPASNASDPSMASKK